jgi:hypothetical protein
VAFEALDHRWLMLAMALRAGDFSQVGVVGIGLHSLRRGFHGGIIAMAGHAGFWRYRLLSGYLLLVAVEALDTGFGVIRRETGLPGSLGQSGKRPQEAAHEDEEAVFHESHGKFLGFR